MSTKQRSQYVPQMPPPQKGQVSKTDKPNIDVTAKAKRVPNKPIHNPKFQSEKYGNIYRDNIKVDSSHTKEKKGFTLTGEELISNSKSFHEKKFQRLEDTINTLSQSQAVKSKKNIAPQTPKSKLSSQTNKKTVKAKSPAISTRRTNNKDKQPEKFKAKTIERNSKYICTQKTHSSKTANNSMYNSQNNTKAYNIAVGSREVKKKLNVLNKETQTTPSEEKQILTQTEEEVKCETNQSPPNKLFNGARLSYYTHSSCLHNIDISTTDLNNISAINQLLKEFSLTLFKSKDQCLSIINNNYQQVKQEELTLIGVQMETLHRSSLQSKKKGDDKPATKNNKGDSYDKLRLFLKTKTIKGKPIDSVPTKKSTKVYYKSRSIDYGIHSDIKTEDANELFQRFDTDLKQEITLSKDITIKDKVEYNEKAFPQLNDAHYLELDKPVLKMKKKPKMKSFDENYTKTKEIEEEADLKVKEATSKVKNLRKMLKKDK